MSSEDTYLVEKLREILLRIHFPSPTTSTQNNNLIPVVIDYPKLKVEDGMKTFYRNNLESSQSSSDIILKKNLNEFIQALRSSLSSSSSSSTSSSSNTNLLNGNPGDYNNQFLPIMPDSVAEYEFNLTDDDIHSLNHLMSAEETGSLAIRHIFLIGLYICIACIAIIGNLLVVELVIRSRRLHTLTHALLANLAVADLFMAGLNIPFSISRVILTEWPFGSFLCQLIPFVQVTSVYVTSITMASIALDRYHVIMNPLGRRMKTSEGVLLVAVIWCLSGLLSLPYALYHKVVTTLTVRIVKRCQANFDSIYSRQWLTILTVLAQYLIPLVITSVSYVSIMHRLGKRTSGLGSTTPRQIEAQSRGKRTTIKMLVLTVIFFAVCWFPINMYHVLTHFSIVRPNSTAILICHLIAMSSTCCNPFIYCWLNEHFRLEALKWLKCFRTKRSPVVHPGVEVNGILTRNDFYRRNQSANTAAAVVGSGGNAVVVTTSCRTQGSNSSTGAAIGSFNIHNTQSNINNTSSTLRNGILKSNEYEEEIIPQNFMRRINRGIFPPELLFLTPPSNLQQQQQQYEEALNENGDEDLTYNDDNDNNIESDFEQSGLFVFKTANYKESQTNSERNDIPLEIFGNSSLQN